MTSINPPRTRSCCGGIPESLWHRFPRLIWLSLLVICFARTSFPASEGAESDFASWVKSPLGTKYFPIGVWLQDPKNAEQYKAAGINLYVGLWRGPNSNQLATLERAGMPVICTQNEFALAHKDNPIIAAWMHDDEPDNAQSLGEGKGYGPPIRPEVIVRDYQKMRAADPSRPILLNLGQAVAWDNYIGRGVRRNHPEDYSEYIKGADIISFDIYPVVHDAPEIRGKLEYVARGVQRLNDWSNGEKIIWNCVECTHIGDPERKATPEQVRAEVWMSLIHGSKGLIYFVHEFKPVFKEAGLLSDPAMLRAVTAINHQIQEFAPVLNSPSVSNLVTVVNQPSEVPVAAMTKQHDDQTYIFAVSMRNQPSRPSFKVAARQKSGKVEVLGEGRSILLENGEFHDDFGGYAVHLYRIKESK